MNKKNLKKEKNTRRKKLANKSVKTCRSRIQAVGNIICTQLNIVFVGTYLERFIHCVGLHMNTYVHIWFESVSAVGSCVFSKMLLKTKQNLSTHKWRISVLLYVQLNVIASGTACKLLELSQSVVVQMHAYSNAILSNIRTFQMNPISGDCCCRCYCSWKTAKKWTENKNETTFSNAIPVTMTRKIKL